MDLLHKSYFQFSLICSCNVRTECMIYVTNPNFNTLLAVKQPWLIKYQMLRYLMGYPQRIFRYLGPSMWFSNRISWIISEVQASKIFFFIFFSFKTASSNPGKWNWHLLSFLPFIFIFPQCAAGSNWVEEKLEGTLSKVWGIETLIFRSCKKQKSQNHLSMDLSVYFVYFFVTK